MPTTRGAALAWLSHPLTIAALAALIINDHFLKRAWPGLVTGKLSDFAGMLLAPPLLTLLFGLIRPRWTPRGAALTATAVVGIGFTFVKLTEAGADAASAVWSALVGPSIIYRDPADLVALPALLAALTLWHRISARSQATAPTRTVLPRQKWPATSMPARVSSSATTSRRGSVACGRVRRLGRIAFVPIAVLAVMATSAPQYRNAEAVYLDADGEIVVTGDLTSLMSRDGVTWRKGEGKAVAKPGLRHDCLPGSTCYRVVNGRMAVEQSADSGLTWTPAWSVSDFVRRRLQEEHYPDVGKYATGGVLESLALIVVPQGQGHVVVVVNGRDGVLVRGVDGAWTRIGFGPDDPAPPLPAAGLASVLQIDLFWGVYVLLLLAGLGTAAALRAGGRGDLSFGLGIATLIAPPVLTCLPGWLHSIGGNGILKVEQVTPGVAAVYFGISATFLLITLALGLRSRVLRWRGALQVVLIGLITAMAIYVPWYLDADAWLLGGLIAVAGLAAALWTGHRLGKSPIT